ncbi:MFS transporter [Conexibacter sp. SYSU D00693]|uniref:MFS transporter n=1 Tax=Conexibacter sp. SYSU D00693 TaxID=2812560 RepID=UPI00196B51A2|nr:MFS transporter [Conexibacter sp. SYSU D00693]
MSATSPTVAPRLRTVPTLRRMPHGPAFWATAVTAVTFPAASAAPSPLYAVYQAQWGFSSSVLTDVFAVYALALLASLLTVGALSDHVGRRPVLLGAIALEVVSLVLFAVADGVGALFLARIVQGLATGAALSTLSAMLIDLQPKHAPGRGGVVNGVAPMAGLSSGALGCGLLVEWAPAPTTLVWLVLVGLMVVSFVLVLATPETSPQRAGARASLRPRVGLPAHLRGDMLALTPGLVASWALGGLYMSLGPSVAAAELGLHSRLTGGVVVALLCATGGVVAFALRGRDPRDVLGLAATFLTAGVAITIVGLEASSAVVAGAGTLVSGIGFGASALAGFGSLARLATPAERGEVYALAFVISYLAFSVPAVAAGLAVSTAGLHTVAVVYSAVILVPGVAAYAGAIAERRRRLALAT